MGASRLQGDGLLQPAIFDLDQGHAAIDGEGPDQLPDLGRLQIGLIGWRHNIGGKIAQIPAIKPGGSICRFLHRQGLEGGTCGHQFLDGLGLLSGRHHDLSGVDLFGPFREL